MLHEFTFNTDCQLRLAIRIVSELGLDYEADIDARTLYVEIETETEYNALMRAYED